MRVNQLKAQIGYKRRYCQGGKPSRIADNILERQFNPEEPNKIWVSDTSVLTKDFYMWPR